MSDRIKLEVPSDSEGGVVEELRNELGTLEEVEGVSGAQRSIDAGTITMILQIAGTAFATAGAALPVLERVIGIFRRKKVTGATIELPDGTKISVDNTTPEQLQELLGKLTQR